MDLEPNLNVYLDPELQSPFLELGVQSLRIKLVQIAEPRQRSWRREVLQSPLGGFHRTTVGSFETVAPVIATSLQVQLRGPLVATAHHSQRIAPLRGGERGSQRGNAHGINQAPVCSCSMRRSFGREFADARSSGADLEGRHGVGKHCAAGMRPAWLANDVLQLASTVTRPASHIERQK